MPVNVVQLRLHKNGNFPKEYEDASKWRVDDIDGKLISRFAVADGATESPYARQWANILCSAYINGEISNEINENILYKIRRQWSDSLPKVEVPWYIEAKIEQGAYAAFVGLQIEYDCQTHIGKASLLAIGDCCIMHVHKTKLRSFPLKRSDKFNSRPMLIGTLNQKLDTSIIRNKVWTCRDGDIFLLMSDALACWFLKMYESGEKSPWKRFDEVKANKYSKRWFRETIQDERREGHLKNDDVTLLKVQIIGSSQQDEYLK